MKAKKKTIKLTCHGFERGFSFEGRCKGHTVNVERFEFGEDWGISVIAPDGEYVVSFSSLDPIEFPSLQSAIIETLTRAMLIPREKSGNIRLTFSLADD